VRTEYRHSVPDGACQGYCDVYVCPSDRYFHFVSHHRAESPATPRAAAEADVSDDDVRRFYEASYAPRKLLVLDPEYVRHTKAGIAADRAYRAAQATPAEGAERPKPGTREHWRGPLCTCGHDALAHFGMAQTEDCTVCDCENFVEANPPASQPAGAVDVKALRDFIYAHTADNRRRAELLGDLDALEQENATLREDAARLRDEVREYDYMRRECPNEAERDARWSAVMSAARADRPAEED
jgi:hypothetical protein